MGTKEQRAAGGGLPAMASPRQLLIISAVAMTIVGWQTFRYPPEFLAYPHLWAGLALFAGILCIVCAIVPRRLIVTASGAILPAICAGRAFALGREILTTDFAADELEASFVIAFVTWILVGSLFYIAWREYIVPWAIASEKVRE